MASKKPSRFDRKYFSNTFIQNRADVHNIVVWKSVNYREKKNNKLIQANINHDQRLSVQIYRLSKHKEKVLCHSGKCRDIDTFSTEWFIVLTGY